MLYFEKIDTKLYLCVEKLPWTSPWAAPEQSPPLTLGTPDQIQRKSFKGQENGLVHILFTVLHWFLFYLDIAAKKLFHVSGWGFVGVVVGLD